MKNFKLIIALALALVMFSGFWSTGSDDKRRNDIQSDSKESLELLYKHKTETIEQIKNAYGYATFTNYGVNMMMFSGEVGTGLAHNNKTGKETYMGMVSGGMGFGLGAKEFRAIFIFETQKVYDRFIEDGWEANAQLDAAMQAENDGDSHNEAYTIEQGMKLYKLTRNGIAMQMTMQGSKYFEDNELND